MVWPVEGGAECGATCGGGGVGGGGGAAATAVAAKGGARPPGASTGRLPSSMRTWYGVDHGASGPALLRSLSAGAGGPCARDALLLRRPALKRLRRPGDGPCSPAER